MLKTYSGSCHCGAVRFQADIDLAQPTYRCNCSVCRRNRFWPAIVAPERFRLLAGEDALTEYRFNTQKIQHLFCESCGIESFARGEMPDGTQMVAINARCLAGVEPTELNSTAYDGRSR